MYIIVSALPILCPKGSKAPSPSPKPKTISVIAAVIKQKSDTWLRFLLKSSRERGNTTHQDAYILKQDGITSVFYLQSKNLKDWLLI